VKNRLLLAIPVLLFPGLVFISCTRSQLESPPLASQMQIYLTDHPALGFDSLWLDLRGLELKTETGWQPSNFLAGLYNITALRNGRDSLVVIDSPIVSSFRKIRLILGPNNFIEKDGQHIPLLLRESDARPELEIESGDFDISDQGTRFWIDVNVAASVRTDNSGSGNHNGYRLDLKFTCFGDKGTGRIRGEVQPAEALPWLELIGEDSIMGIPEADGKFEWRGVKPAVYQIKIHAANGYADTILKNIQVNAGTEARVPLVQLHR